MERWVVLAVVLAAGLWLLAGGVSRGDDGAWLASGETVSLRQEAGRVGIGTREPGAKVHVVAAQEAASALWAEAVQAGEPAVRGRNDAGQGVQGRSRRGVGVEGISIEGLGVSGLSQESSGVQGDSVTGSGVRGLSSTGPGVEGVSGQGPGLKGSSDSDSGVFGISTTSAGLLGVSISGTALELVGFQGEHLIQASDAAVRPEGVRFQVARATGEAWASGGYLAPAHGLGEALPVAAGAAPGDALSVRPDGTLGPSQTAYDTAVVGVYAAAAALVGGTPAGGGEAGAVLMAGAARVNASAENGAIRPGDLLTTAAAPGRVMRCEALEKCFGALVGKALEGLEAGEGEILVVLALN